MTFHALVIDDNPGILDGVQDRLECLGHTYDCVSCLQCARDRLAQNRYSYILLDLEIPVQYGRPSRIPNGQNLLREIRQMKGYEDIPIIVMTTHGHDSPDLAVEVLRGNGAIDYVKKPFPDRGHTLEQAIHDALAASGRSRPGAATRSGPIVQEPPQPFASGEMVFSPRQVELCGVKICGGAESGMIRRILDELRQTNPHGRFVRYDGTTLAKRIGCRGEQNGVADAVRHFRNRACEVILEEANIKMDRLHDVILNDRRYGYRLSSKITVYDADDPVHEPQSSHRDVVNDPQNGAADDTHDLAINDRQRWALAQMRTAGSLRKADLVDQFHCSVTTAERDLRALRRRGLVEFVGATRTGRWQLRPTAA